MTFHWRELPRASGDVPPSLAACRRRTGRTGAGTTPLARQVRRSGPDRLLPLEALDRIGPPSRGFRLRSRSPSLPLLELEFQLVEMRESGARTVALILGDHQLEVAIIARHPTPGPARRAARRRRAPPSALRCHGNVSDRLSRDEGNHLTRTRR